MGKKRGLNKIRQGDQIINQYGVKISQDEEKRLQSLVRAVNRKRNIMIDKFADKPLYYGKRRLDENRAQLQMMGDEMDIIIRKRSAAVNQFKSRKEFTSYLRGMERTMSTDYMEYRGKLYKRNYMTALKKEFAQFPDALKGVLMKVRMMPQAQFQELVGMDRLFNIRTVYSTAGKMDQLGALREKLGLSDMEYEDIDDI